MTNSSRTPFSHGAGVCLFSSVSFFPSPPLSCSPPLPSHSLSVRTRSFDLLKDILNKMVAAFTDRTTPSWARSGQGLVFVGLLGIAGYWLLIQSRVADSLPWWGKSLFPWLTYLHVITLYLLHSTLYYFIRGDLTQTRYSSSILGIGVLFISKGRPARDELFLRITLLLANLGTTVLLLAGPNSAQHILMLFTQCVSTSLSS